MYITISSPFPLRAGSEGFAPVQWLPGGFWRGLVLTLRESIVHRRISTNFPGLPGFMARSSGASGLPGRFAAGYPPGENVFQNRAG